MNNWQIVDQEKVLHSGNEADIRFIWKIICNPNDFDKKTQKDFCKKSIGIVKLIQVHAIKQN